MGELKHAPRIIVLHDDDLSTSEACFQDLILNITPKTESEKKEEAENSADTVLDHGTHSRRCTQYKFYLSGVLCFQSKAKVRSNS